MSQTSLILLSEDAQPEHLAAALERTQDGERLLIVPPHLQPFTGKEPALNINQPSKKLTLQLLDATLSALRPTTILADIKSLQKINKDRHPNLKIAIIIPLQKQKTKHLKTQAKRFQHSQILGKK